MKNERYISMLAVVLSLLTASLRAKAEKKITKSELPPAVVKTADVESRGATVHGYSVDREGGKLVYEVEMTVNSHSRDVTIAADGTVLEVEEEIALAGLPAETQAALKQRAGKGAITKVESLTRKGTLVGYEAQVRNGSKHSEIEVDAAGRTPQPNR